MPKWISVGVHTCTIGSSIVDTTARQRIISLPIRHAISEESIVSVRPGRRAFVLFTSIVAVVWTSAALFAHHGSFISYDTTKQWTKKVVVTEFHYANPHPQLFFDVMDEKGTVENWGAELLPNPAQLINNGWSRKRSTEALKAGTRIVVTVAPSKAGTHVGLLIKMTNEAGEELLAGGAGTPNPLQTPPQR